MRVAESHFAARAGDAEKQAKTRAAHRALAGRVSLMDSSQENLSIIHIIVNQRHGVESVKWLDGHSQRIDPREAIRSY